MGAGREKKEKEGFLPFFFLFALSHSAGPTISEPGTGYINPKARAKMTGIVNKVYYWVF